MMADPIATSAVLDPATLANLRRMQETRKDLFAILLRAFEGEAPAVLAALRAAAGRGRRGETEEDSPQAQGDRSQPGSAPCCRFVSTAGDDGRRRQRR